MNPILIIGATGTVGGQVVQQLTAMGTPVRALVRNPAAADLPQSVDVIEGDLTRPETLDASLNGIDTVFLVWTAPPPAFAPAFERIAKHARRIVFLSAPLKTPHPLFQQPNRARDLGEQIERSIEASGLQWTFLRPGMFAANALLWWAPQIRAGNVVRWPYLDVPTAPIDERDIAAIAVRALTEDHHAGAEYLITGPDSLTHSAQISIISRVINRPLKVEEIPPDEAPRELQAIMPLPAANMLCNAWAAAVGHPAFMTRGFQEITGTPPRSFLTWVTDHITEFKISVPAVR